MLTGTLHIAWDTLTIGEDSHDLEEYAAFTLLLLRPGFFPETKNYC
jgi:hypothetical protein